jgi:hypothetical protein
MSPRRALALPASLALLLAALAAGPAGAQPSAHATLRGFLPTGRFAVYTFRQPDPEAVVCFAQRAAAYLVLGSRYQGGTPFLLQLGNRTVSSVAAAGVLAREDGSYDLAADAVVTPLGSFEITGTDMTVGLGEEVLQAKLTPKPPLEGQADGDAVLKHTPEYGRDDYVLDQGVIQRMAAAQGSVEIEIFFGTWCPLCKRYMGRVLKTDRALRSSSVRFTYFGLPSPPQAWEDPAFLAKRVERLPTAIVYSGGREVGRISGNEIERFEVNVSRFVR